MSHCFTARLAAIMLLAGAAAPALARQSTDIVERAVSTHGLNLASPAGQQELRQRLLIASRAVCKEATGDDENPNYEACVNTSFHTASADAALLIANARGANQLAAK